MEILSKNSQKWAIYAQNPLFLWVFPHTLVKKDSWCWDFFDKSQKICQAKLSEISQSALRLLQDTDNANITQMSHK